METNVKDRVGRGTIRGWLENYQALIAEDRRPDDMPRNSGCKPNDGVTDCMLNRIILTQGLKAMNWEARLLYSCCRARWIDKDGFVFTLRRLGLSKDQYYKRCDWAIDFLYFQINGMKACKTKLLRKLKRIGVL